MSMVMKFVRSERQQQRAVSDRVATRVPEGMIERIQAVLHGGELISDFARTALDAELRRREKRAKVSG
jgi:hypothetical protein